MIDSPRISEIIRSVAATEVIPRFGALVEGDIVEKAPGDLVTVADRAAETALTGRLTALLPGSVVVGEEAVAADPAILGLIDGDAPVWIIDPIDGTHNFVSGSPRFATLVALAHHGELLASWTYAPVYDLLATATKGGGAFVDGERVTTGPGGGLRFLDVAISPPRWLTDAQRATYNALAAHGVSLSFFDTSGLQYIELAAGRRTAMVCGWEYPWDHAAGLLLHAEAGGVTLTADGSPFRLSGGNTLPFVCAPDAATALAVHTAMGASPAAGAHGEAVAGA
ncbi:inositol monophosphatase family protein [Actinocorallia longicatena]|uniref:Inositol monophosphatase family protein n=1 Tax=Actinocorallia longicatena TaxID=111803 RepID=A0ABP6QED4_9ACTN